MKPIITCDLPLPIQLLYIKRLKHMIWRWEYENFCGHCPITIRFSTNVPTIKKLIKYHIFLSGICGFCVHNINLKCGSGCPCSQLKPPEALKRAKDFIERFEAEEGGENERT